MKTTVNCPCDDCGDDRCKCQKRECCGECRDACRMDSTYKCRCHGDGCPLEGCANECGKRFRDCRKRDCGQMDCSKGRCEHKGFAGGMGCNGACDMHHKHACKMDCGEGCGKMKGHHGHIGPMGLMAPEFQRRMKLQGRIDAELELCRCQEKRLSHIYEANNKIERALMHRFFTDERVDINQLNWQMTALHNKVDWHTRGQLNPTQHAIFPAHEWSNYCLGIWDEGFHPGADYVLSELDGHGRKQCRMVKPCCPPEG